MRRLAGVAVLVGLILVGTSAWAADLDGRVQTVLIADRMVLLEDGKQVWIAEDLSMEELEEGIPPKEIGVITSQARPPPSSTSRETVCPRATSAASPRWKGSRLRG
jgi:hypothetical protein